MGAKPNSVLWCADSHLWSPSHPGESYLDLSVPGDFGFYKPSADVALEFETSELKVTECT